MEEFPFVSIVIASFNRKDIIEESISSALNQSYPKNKFEILLVDNNSSDGTIQEVNLLFADQIIINAFISYMPFYLVYGRELILLVETCYPT